MLIVHMICIGESEIKYLANGYNFKILVNNPKNCNSINRIE
jgi:hypothetical protein